MGHRVALRPGARRITLGRRQGDHISDFVADLRQLNATPHVAQNDSGRRSAIDTRTTAPPWLRRQPAEEKRIEEPIGWGKVIGGLGVGRTAARARKALALSSRSRWRATTLIRIPKLLGAPA